MEIFRKKTVWLLLTLSALAFVVMGYHPGAEDDTVYVTAVKADLNPALYTHDSDFFRIQLQATAFDPLMAGFVRVTHLPVAWAELLWQFLSIFLILTACWQVISRLFEEGSARWGAMAMLAAMFTLPVAGTALYIVDQYLHPRALATALILFGVSRIMAGKQWHAVPLLAGAFALHPMMGALGISFCCVLTLTFSQPVHALLRSLRRREVAEATTPAAAMLPLGWLLEPPTKSWLTAISSRPWLRLYDWTWYEWLGAIAPLILFYTISRIARRQGNANLAAFSTAVLAYGIFQQVVAMIVLGPRQLIVLSALEPMRYLHLVYVFLALIAGAYLGKMVLRRHVGRWAVFLLVANGGMFVAQRQLFAGTSHLELPGMEPANPWLQAFDWIRQNTPEDAYFALDPNYMIALGEDYHSFRALAERSQLADVVKDSAVLTKVPALGPTWERQVAAQAGWTRFTLADFERLKAEFGVNWALVSFPAPLGLTCRWHNESLSVCQIP
ncbi:MAG: DUF6798 domain-containing protein [Terracidiphilus sp.]